MNYYNEFDKNAAAWLRELIKKGLIPNGDVDERSIKDVTANDLRSYTQCHFFAGIGGWSYALQLAGWPTDRPVWTGSCPCQCYSVAGKQLGVKDERDLWPVFYELIRQCKPQYVFGEQVENAIRHDWLDRVYTDLEAEDYTVRAVVLGAHSVNAPHQRQRLYWGGASLAEDSMRIGWRGGNQGTQEREQLSIQAQGLGDGGGVSNIHSKRRNRQSVSNEQRAGVPEVMRSSAVDRLAILQSDRRSERDTDNGGGVEAAGKQNRPSDSGDVLPCRMADDTFNREPSGISGQEQGNERESGELVDGSLSNLSAWSDFRFIYCRDGKVRRIPAESLFFSVADGLSGCVDGGGIICVSEDGGFPLTTKKKGRSPLLKGYGNAIVPELAAEFITTFTEASK